MSKNNVNKKSKNNKKGVLKTIIIIVLVLCFFMTSFRDIETNKTPYDSEETTSQTTTTTATTTTKKTTTKKTTVKKTTTKQKTTNQKQETTTSSYNNDYTYTSATMEYYCSAGYTLDGVMCIKEVIVSADINYSCDSGVLKGTYCESEERKSVSYTTSAKAKCSNYSNAGMYQKCVCEKSGGEYTLGGCYTIKEVRTKAEESYYCRMGGELIGTNCKTEEYQVANYRYVCPDGYRNIGSGLCEKNN